MFTEHIRAGTVALAIALLPAGLAGCATEQGPGGPVVREEIVEEGQYAEPDTGPFLNEALFGDPRYEYELGRPGPEFNADFYTNGIGGPELYPGGPAADQSLLAVPPPALPPTGEPFGNEPKPQW